MSESRSERATDHLGKLILTRLLAAGQPPARAGLDQAIKRFFADRLSLSDSDWGSLLDTVLEQLASGELIQTRPFVLTDKGRGQALAFLGVDALPPGVKWQTIRNRYLLAKALEIHPQRKTEWDRLGTSEGFQAAFLSRHFELPTGAVPTMARALHALAWKQLLADYNLPVPADKDFTRDHVLRTTLMKGHTGKPAEQLTAMVLGTPNRRPDTLREAIICRWLDEGNSETTAAVAFADQVHHAARSSPTGRFGEHKVFISHVWEHFRQLPAAHGMSRDEFNDRLLEANRAMLLTLARADLVGAMDPQDVQKSEIRLPHATFHFIRTDR